MANPTIDIASTIQSASIKQNPSAAHDLNPSTAASTKRPVSPTASISSNADSIPESALKPVPRKATLPPLPDLRFEQSYLASLKGVESKRAIAWITVRDQVILPLVQGTLWTLALSGWRYWNRTAQYQGASWGSQVRRWWWSVNKWPIPQAKHDEKMAEHVGEFYKHQLGSGQGD
ncbi:MAG: hypothetical protein HETSPECPRED_005090 [Heterodermia speciosa]|uniref:DUF1770-domain-containing protein n=1 Tax=Heterodermia speciosa TaxID=116794 RepID=A0A8H3IKT8_9LECA|nr:MAG: hypothetical protein HETSPECPRED_005090 [Heterodermia speciosa]